MNRLKLWLYMLVFLCAGAANLYVLSQELAARALMDADQELDSAVSAFRGSEQLIATRAAAVTALAATDPALLEALAARPAEPEGKKKGKGPAAPEDDPAAEAARHAAAEAAAKAAVEKAAVVLGIELPPSTTWAVANPEGLKKPRATDEGPQKEIGAFLRAAAAGTPRRGYALVNDSLWYGVALPAGEGSALVLFLPLDAAWAAQLRGSAAAEVTLDAGTPQLVTTTAGPLARPLVTAAVAAGGRPAGVGRAPPVLLQKPLAFKAPLLFVQAPATRVVAVPLAGVPKGHLVLSVDTARTFVALGQYQWTTITVLVGLLLVGLLLGVLVKTEIAPQVPEPLLSAASKIERGDFSARAPVLAGKLGTVVAALNKAAEVAQVAHAPAPAVDPFAAPPPSPEPIFELPPRPAAPAPIAPPPPPPPPRPAPAPAPAPAPSVAAEAREDTQRLDGAAAQAESAFASESFAARPVPRPTVAVTAVGMTAAAMPAVGQVPGPAPEEDEEGHWRAVHAEFLRVRAECGEPTEGLGFDRFRPKLEKNRDALIAKYACRTVRFQVYVKDGKAALKATPVR